MDVQWRDIKGYEGFYQVSSDGRVRSVARKIEKRARAGVVQVLSIKPRILKRKLHPAGYPMASLSRQGIVVQHLIHRLVLVAFVGECPEGLEACHNDGDPGNATLANLRWDTHLSNIRDKASHGTQTNGDRHGTSILSDADALAIKMRRAKGERGSDLAAEFGIAQQTVCAIHKNRSWRQLSGNV